MALRRGGKTVGDDSATTFVRELQPPAKLPEPRTVQMKLHMADPICAIPRPYTRVESHSEPQPFATGDGVTHLARSAIYASSANANVVAGGTTTLYSYCVYGVVASSSSQPVTTRLTGTTLDALGDNTPEELNTGVKRCYNEQTCLWDSNGSTVSSTTGVRVYATGEHDITSGSHTKEVNTSGGVLVINNYLYYATP